METEVVVSKDNNYFRFINKITGRRVSVELGSLSKFEDKQIADLFREIIKQLK